MLWPDAIVLDGQAIPLDSVLASVQIHHGRTEIFAEPTATTAQLVIREVTRAFVQAVHVGARLQITAKDVAGASLPRFTGTITDANLDVDTLTIIAAGRLSTLTEYIIGAAGIWPVETWSARVLRCFTEAGLVAPNAVSNPSCETLDYWGGWSAGTNQPVLQLSGDADHVHSGSYALFWTFQNTDAAANVWLVGNNPATVTRLPLVPGRRYKLECYGSGYAGMELGVARSDGGWYCPTWNPTYFEPIKDGYRWRGRNGDRLGAIFTCPEDCPAGLTGAVGVIAPTVQPGETLYGAGDDWRFVDADSDVLDLRPDPDFDPLLAARDSSTAGPTTLGDYLTFLAPMVGAAIVDGLDGTIMVQAIGARHLAAPVPLDPADVHYAPAWTQILPLANIVQVRYTGDQSESVTLQDEGSLALYDRERRQTIDTTFTDVADASRRADEYLRRSAYAHWNVLEAPIVRGLTLEVGEAITLSELPPAAPYDPWTPIVEGWSDAIEGDDWTMQLALSDPALSGLVTLAWQDVPAGYLWNTINPATEWREAIVLDALEPV